MKNMKVEHMKNVIRCISENSGLCGSIRHVNLGSTKLARAHCLAPGPQMDHNSIKNKKYPIWRLDTIFSKRKYNDILIINNGGWHFTNIKSPEDIEKKLLNYTHHYEYEQSGLKLSDIKNMVNTRRVIYDHSIDQRGYKWKGSKTLKKVNLSEMPDYLSENYKKYYNWLEI